MFGADEAKQYDKWFESKSGRYVDEKEKQFLSDSFKDVSGRILEIGCGTGRNMEYLKEKGFDITGIDSSEQMLKIAGTKKVISRNLVAGSAEKLPFKDNEFEAVLFMTSLEFVNDKDTALKEAFRVASHKIVIGFLNKYGATNISRRNKNKGSYEGASFISGKSLATMVKKAGNGEWGFKDRIKYAVYMPVKHAYKLAFFDILLERINLPVGNFGLVQIVKKQKEELK